MSGRTRPPSPVVAKKDRVSSDELRARLRTPFEDEWRFEREPGRGGMAAVLLAHELALERRGVVKLPLPHVSLHADVVERLLREAHTVEALQHPHIMTVHGVRSRDNVHAIALQFVDGMRLGMLLVESGPPRPLQAARMLSQAAAGPQQAHDRGVVPRDAKPSNVLVDVRATPTCRTSASPVATTGPLRPLPASTSAHGTT